MGFSYRKSVTVGRIRITRSRSGTSYSTGTSGVRITKRANGRIQTTVSVPGTGLRYTHTSSKRRPTKASRPPKGPKPPKPEYTKADWIGAGIFLGVLLIVLAFFW